MGSKMGPFPDPSERGLLWIWVYLGVSISPLLPIMWESGILEVHFPGRKGQICSAQGGDFGGTLQKVVREI